MPDEGLTDYVKELKNKERKRVEQHPPVGPMAREMKEIKICPYCAEEILAAAVKCKHCHSFLDHPGKKQDAVEKPHKNASWYISENEHLVISMLFLGIYGIYQYLIEAYMPVWIVLGLMIVIIIRRKHARYAFKSDRSWKYLHYFALILTIYWAAKLLILLSEKYHKW